MAQILAAQLELDFGMVQAAANLSVGLETAAQGRVEGLQRRRRQGQFQLQLGRFNPAVELEPIGAEAELEPIGPKRSGRIAQ